jgi:hypothetical protein
LKDESKRRTYDLSYPFIRQSRPAAQTTQTPRPPPTSSPQSGSLNEAAEIALLEKSKQDRRARWWTKKNAFDSSIFELQRDIRRLKQDIQNLDSIVTAEAAEEAKKNSWGVWLLSPIYKKAEVSHEEKVRKDIERQERKIEKDMKERRLGLKKAELEKEENLLRKGMKEVDAADLVDNGKIRAIQDRIRARETRERQEREMQQERERQKRERQERERRERERQERERMERERVAAILKQRQEEAEKAQRERMERERAHMERIAAIRKRQEKHARHGQKTYDEYMEQHHSTAEGSTFQASKILCGHDGWWPKVQGREPCPECRVIWTYLLQCPSCKMKACPKCQAVIRPRSTRGIPRVRTPSDGFYDDSF